MLPGRHPLHSGRTPEMRQQRAEPCQLHIICLGYRKYIPAWSGYVQVSRRYSEFIGSLGGFRSACCDAMRMPDRATLIAEAPWNQDAPLHGGSGTSISSVLPCSEVNRSNRPRRAAPAACRGRSAPGRVRCAPACARSQRRPGSRQRWRSRLRTKPSRRRRARLPAGACAG